MTTATQVLRLVSGARIIDLGENAAHLFGGGIDVEYARVRPCFVNKIPFPRPSPSISPRRWKAINLVLHVSAVVAISKPIACSSSAVRASADLIRSPRSGVFG